jgi:hypothetical protein
VTTFDSLYFIGGVNAHYIHMGKVDENPFLQSKSNDFSRKKFK